MRWILKKMFVSLATFSTSFSAFAVVEVDVINLAEKPVVFSYFTNNYEWQEFEQSMIPHGHGKTFYSWSKPTIDGKYKINFVDSRIPCAWVHLWPFGTEEVHGMGIRLVVNETYAGIICANRATVAGSTNYAKLEYFTDNKGQNFLKFSNTGWWENGNKFPISISINLKEIDERRIYNSFN